MLAVRHVGCFATFVCFLKDLPFDASSHAQSICSPHKQYLIAEMEKVQNEQLNWYQHFKNNHMNKG